MGDTEGIYADNADWFRDNDFCWFSDDKFKNRKWQIGNLKEYQSLKLTNKLCERVAIQPNMNFGTLGQARAVYDAVIMEKDMIVERNIIVKIFMRIPAIHGKEENDYVVSKDDLMLHMSSQQPIREEIPERFQRAESIASRPYGNEWGILKHLTDKGCQYTPQYITHSEKNQDNPWIINGLLGFVVMTKVPGVRISDIWTKAAWPEQCSIMTAFRIAFMEVRRHGVIHGDAALRNVIWDKNNPKCYVIDFESSKQVDPEPDIKWGDLINPKVHPDYTLLSWGFENEETREKMAKHEKAWHRGQAQSSSLT